MKAREEGREFEFSKETLMKLSVASKRQSSESRTKQAIAVRKTIRAKVANGQWHTSVAKRMHYTHRGIALHGKWELFYARHLDDYGIRWQRNTERFPYFYQGVDRYYTPDFYLPGLDVYVEIKGYETEKDKAKWTQFPKTKGYPISAIEIPHRQAVRQ